MTEHPKQYDELWNEICFILSEQIIPGINEAGYQKEVIRVLEKLGWRQFKREILEQVPIPSGTSSKLADIIVQNPETGLPYFVVEIKRPQNDSTEQKTASQLLSYMRFKKCEIGLIIGNLITIIWDDRQSTTTDYLEILQIPFSTVDNANGIEFATIFSKEHFVNVETVRNYIKAKVYEIQQKSAYIDVKNQLFSNDFHKSLIDFMKAEIGKTLNDKMTEQLVNEINIEISPKHQPNTVPIQLLPEKHKYHRSSNALANKVSSSNSKDYTQYQFNGKVYGKGRLVLAVVGKYVKDNPNTSYSLLDGVFPKYIQGSHCVFAKVEEAINSGKTDKIRFFVKENEQIKLRDAVIAVSTEWGKGNIGKLIQAANSMGYGITAIES
jgi:hypothetical protein